jgi:hypothetical protein
LSSVTVQQGLDRLIGRIHELEQTLFGKFTKSDHLSKEVADVLKPEEIAFYHYSIGSSDKFSIIVRPLIARIGEAKIDKAELEQTLLNEQGKGEPPSPDWEWAGAYWSHKHRNIIVSLYRQGDVVSWETIINGVAIDDLSDTARAAMRAAEGK